MQELQILDLVSATTHHRHDVVDVRMQPVVRVRQELPAVRANETVPVEQSLNRDPLSVAVASLSVIAQLDLGDRPISVLGIALVSFACPLGSLWLPLAVFFAYVLDVRSSEPASSFTILL